MKIKSLHKPFEIESLQVSAYKASEHRKTYFEMVFVLEGDGIQIINEHVLPYAPNKLFLIFPDDVHEFEIDGESHFFLLRFNRSYLNMQNEDWRKKMEYIFNNHNRFPGCILKNKDDKTLVRSVVQSLITESETLNNQEVVNQLIYVLITVAARNIMMMNNAIETDKVFSYKILISLSITSISISVNQKC